MEKTRRTQLAFGTRHAPLNCRKRPTSKGRSDLLEVLRLVLDPSLPDSEGRLRGEDFWNGLEKTFAGNKITIKVFIKDFDNNRRAQAILFDLVVCEK